MNQTMHKNIIIITINEKNKGNHHPKKVIKTKRNGMHRWQMDPPERDGNEAGAVFDNGDVRVDAIRILENHVLVIEHAHVHLAHALDRVALYNIRI